MKTAYDIFLEIIEANRKGLGKGIYSVCSAHPSVLEACFEQAKADESMLLIESTSNQVDQYGGYTGMKPADFISYVEMIAKKCGFPKEMILFGGDHLGPNPWRDLSAENAMDRAKVLIAEYIKAGFQKIHLDTSMFCADDTGDRHKPLSDDLVAARTAILCSVAEETWKKYRKGDKNKPLYIIGTEVPVPGGAQETEEEVNPTTIADAEKTIVITRKHFNKSGLSGAWERVVGAVVQPGVEFGDDWIFHYNSEKSNELSEKIMEFDRMVFETHSTDYQTEESLKALVCGHFCILKVGPWLTFAFREALLALEAMETEILGKEHKELSRLGETLERVMIREPKYWKSYYQGTDKQQAFKRKYSFSDRARYYWPVPEVGVAKDKLLENLEKYKIPLSLLSQFMPEQFMQVCQGRIRLSPGELVHSHIRTVTGIYARACNLSN